MSGGGPDTELPQQNAASEVVTAALAELGHATVDQAFKALHVAAYERLAVLMEDMHRQVDAADPDRFRLEFAWRELVSTLELIGVR